MYSSQQVFWRILKGSFELLKRTLFLCIWCNAMFLSGLMLKKHYFPQTVHYFCSSIPAFLKHVDFYKAHRSEKRGVLWLASYPVHCDWPNTSSMWQKCYAPYRILMPCPGAKTHKKINPIINEVFVASDGEIITYYNGVYCLFTRCVASRRINKNMYLQAVSQKFQTVLAKLELLHFIETAFEHSWQAPPRFRK